MPKDSEQDITLSPRLEKLADEYAKDPRSRKFLPLAEEYRKSGMLEEAIFLCTEGLKNHPNFFAAKMTLARCYLETQDYDHGVGQLLEVVEKQPENTQAHRLLADYFYSRGASKDALKHYQAIQEISPGDKQIDERISELSAPADSLPSSIDLSRPDRELPSSAVETEDTKFVSDRSIDEEIKYQDVSVDRLPKIEVTQEVEGEEEASGETELDLEPDERYDGLSLSLGRESGDLEVAAELQTEEPEAGEREAEGEIVEEYEETAEAEDSLVIEEEEVRFADFEGAPAVDEHSEIETEARAEVEIDVTDIESAVEEEPERPERDTERRLRSKVEVFELDTCGEEELLAMPSEVLRLSEMEIYIKGEVPTEDGFEVPEPFAVVAESGRELDQVDIGAPEMVEEISDVEFEKVEEETFGEGTEQVVFAAEEEPGVLEAETMEEEGPAAAPPEMPAEVSSEADLELVEEEIVEEEIVEVETAPEEEPAVPSTLTSATILEQQGHTEKALKIYRSLLREAPHDEVLQGKVEDLQAKLLRPEVMEEEPGIEGNKQLKIKILSDWLANIEAFRRRKNLDDRER
jgi:tetratricopeptide (TPR) repeat protein